jgi:hypothetical protein
MENNGLEQYSFSWSKTGEKTDQCLKYDHFISSFFTFIMPVGNLFLGNNEEKNKATEKKIVFFLTLSTGH